jgi:hypothetical protein
LFENLSNQLTQLSGCEVFENLSNQFSSLALALGTNQLLNELVFCGVCCRVCQEVVGGVIHHQVAHCVCLICGVCSVVKSNKLNLGVGAFEIGCLDCNNKEFQGRVTMFFLLFGITTPLSCKDVGIGLFIMFVLLGANGAIFKIGKH